MGLRNKSGDNVFAVIYRTRRPEQDLLLFITGSADQLNEHIANDEMLMGVVLSKGTINQRQMNWGEVRVPMTRQHIPELLRRAFAQHFINDFHLDDFLAAQISVLSKPLGFSIARVLGRTVH